MPCPESLYFSFQNENSKITFDRIIPCIAVITTSTAIGIYLYFIYNS